MERFHVDALEGFGERLREMSGELKEESVCWFGDVVGARG